MYQSISVTQAAKIKQTSRQTIYSNKKKFDWMFDALEIGRIIPNLKFQNWQPKMTGGRSKK
jgi:hypothetical protein